MKFVITLLGRDRLGIVESFSKTVADHNGAWCESRIMQVEGQFAGVFLAEIPAESSETFEASLEGSFQPEFHLAVVRSNADEESAPARHSFEINVLCSDRPGLVHEFAQLCTARKINILELQTNLRPAAMTGLMMFEISAVGDSPYVLDQDEFASAFEALGDDVVVDFSDQEPAVR
jgi:glycine cleavage system regulatory protein